MPIQTLGVRNLHTAQDQFSPLDQSMNIITDANMNHAQHYRAAPWCNQGISPRLASEELLGNLLQHSVSPTSRIRPRKKFFGSPNPSNCWGILHPDSAKGL